MDTIRGAKARPTRSASIGLDQPRTMADGRVYLGRPQAWPTWRKDEVRDPVHVPEGEAHGPADDRGPGLRQGQRRQRRRDERYDNCGLFGGVKVNRAPARRAGTEDVRHEEGPVDSEAFRKFLHRAVEGNWVKNGSIANAKR